MPVANEKKLRVYEALARLELDPNFKVFVEHLKEMLDEEKLFCVLAESPATHQGKAQMLLKLLELINNARQYALKQQSQQATTTSL